MDFEIKNNNVENINYLYSKNKKKKYSYLKIKNIKNKEMIKISNNNKTVYVIDDFIEDDKVISLNYKFTNILYNLLYRPLPTKYFK